MISFLLDEYAEVELLAHTVVLSLIFCGNSILFSTVAAPIYIFTNSTQGFPFLTSLPIFVVCRFFDDGHSDPCEVIPHCSFDLHFSDD